MNTTSPSSPASLRLVHLPLVEQQFSFETEQGVVQGGDGGMPRTEPPVRALGECEVKGDRLKILESDLQVISDPRSSPQRSDRRRTRERGDSQAKGVVFATPKEVLGVEVNTSVFFV
jgi:hypothetical protein